MKGELSGETCKEERTVMKDRGQRGSPTPMLERGGMDCLSVGPSLRP